FPLLSMLASMAVRGPPCPATLPVDSDDLGSSGTRFGGLSDSIEVRNSRLGVVSGCGGVGYCGSDVSSLPMVLSEINDSAMATLLLPDSVLSEVVDSATVSLQLPDSVLSEVDDSAMAGLQLPEQHSFVMSAKLFESVIGKSTVESPICSGIQDAHDAQKG
ncbi:hypothetical protein Dimus_005553, partial [Dionaea muscipula]